MKIRFRCTGMARVGGAEASHEWPDSREDKNVLQSLCSHSLFTYLELLRRVKCVVQHIRALSPTNASANRRIDADSYGRNVCVDT